MDEDLDHEQYKLAPKSAKLFAKVQEKRFQEYEDRARAEAKAPRYEMTEKLQRNHLLPYGNGLPDKPAHETATFMQPSPGHERMKALRIKEELMDINPPSSYDGVKSTKSAQDKWFYNMMRDKDIKENKALAKKLMRMEQEEKTYTFQPKINDESTLIMERVAKRDDGLIAPRQKLRVVVNDNQNVKPIIHLGQMSG